MAQVPRTSEPLGQKETSPSCNMTSNGLRCDRLEFNLADINERESSEILNYAAPASNPATIEG
jgi:hypothetical protein